MNKLPAKQIYLLAVIVVGIIALSVYSTYALFTFEASTSDIVSIHTPKSLTISENIYEYQQLKIEPNTTSTTDIDISNTFDDDACYSIWYEIIGNNIDTNKVQIFEISSNNLTSSGVLTPKESIRVTIAIVNDNDKSVQIKLGTIGSKKEEDSCSLNLVNDKKQITTSYKSIKLLNEEILEKKDLTKEEPENYLIYKDETKTITYKNIDKIFVSNKFTYSNEIFTLDKPIELTIEELANKLKLETNDTYFCKETDKCSILYKITKIEKEEHKENEKIEIDYHINLYDKLVGYLTGTNGLRKINDTDYVFYGDNPDNYIYYNCKTDAPETCELWRIIGVFYNKETTKYNVKIIKNDSIGKYQFNDKTDDNSLTWNNSTLYKYINKEYKFINSYDAYIESRKTNIETLTSINDKINSIENTNASSVNILTLSDYLNASTCNKNKIIEYDNKCLTNNWLNNIEIEREWSSTLKELPNIKTETPSENIPEEGNDLIDQNLTNSDDNDNTISNENNNQENNAVINYAYGIGNNINENNVNIPLDVRPVIYLKPRILFVGGNGTFTSPYIIK